MDKQQAQEIANSVASNNARIEKMNAVQSVVNEGGEGFYLEKESANEKLNAYGFVENKGKVYGKEDWEGIRKIWNDAVNANKGKEFAKLIKAVEQQTGFNTAFMSLCKSVFA